MLKFLKNMVVLVSSKLERCNKGFCNFGNYYCNNDSPQVYPLGLSYQKDFCGCCDFEWCCYMNCLS